MVAGNNDIVILKDLKMVNFKLGETNVKMKLSACHERGTKKKFKSPTGFEPMTSQTPGGCSSHFELRRTFILSPHNATSTLLILAVSRTRVKYEPSKWPEGLYEF